MSFSSAFWFLASGRRLRAVKVRHVVLKVSSPESFPIFWKTLVRSGVTATKSAAYFLITSMLQFGGILTTTGLKDYFTRRNFELYDYSLDSVNASYD